MQAPYGSGGLARGSAGSMPPDAYRSAVGTDTPNMSVSRRTSPGDVMALCTMRSIRNAWAEKPIVLVIQWVLARAVRVALLWLRNRCGLAVFGQRRCRSSSHAVSRCLTGGERRGADGPQGSHAAAWRRPGGIAAGGTRSGQRVPRRRDTHRPATLRVSITRFESEASGISTSSQRWLHEATSAATSTSTGIPQASRGTTHGVTDKPHPYGCSKELITMIHRLRANLAYGLRAIRENPEHGAETVDTIMWIAIFIVVVGGIGMLFRDTVTQYWNSLVITIGF
ncbi:hypothetical protein ACGF3C_19720 [Micromonospora sp. NPDC047762]|uniref:hypothetical protein n=1 Tax=Micromonospora sp. NPDC047762 TaxID=3364255 RepID=UPI003713A970